MEHTSSITNRYACLGAYKVDIASLEFVRPRSIEVEHVGLGALRLLGLSGILAAG